MSREFPDFVEPWRLADGRREIGGTIPLARLKRLLPLLSSPQGEADFRLRFGYDAQQRATVWVEVSAPLTLLCQASLEPYTEKVHQRSVLLIIADAAEQANLSDQEEFVLVEEGRMTVSDLVEDELLLAIPQVPRNPNLNVETGNRSISESAPDEPETRRPFASLAELMKKQVKH